MRMPYICQKLSAVAITLFLLCFSQAKAIDHYQAGRSSWDNGHYRDAYEHLATFRQGPYGRQANVDYMLGTSGCRLDDLHDWGGDMLEWMLHRYALSEQARTLVYDELTLCRQTEMTDELHAPESNMIFASLLIGASARASGKTFYWVGKDASFNAYPAYRVKEIPEAELRGRLTSLSEPEKAVELTEELAPGFTVTPYQRFILASNSGHSPQLLDKMALYLERYLEFLNNEYDVSLPDSFVTVYMVPSSYDLAKLAEKLHGLKIGRATFGYSFRDDMSVLVAIPADFLIGTIMHEFFHLATRSHFGDIPQWLDEGVASLYEVSKFEGDKVLGIPNWRGRVLRELMAGDPAVRPTIRQMVTSSWFAFEQYEMAKELQEEHYGESPPARQMAAMLATARYFTLYLQETDKLTPIYRDLRQLTPGNGTMPPAEESIRVIEHHLGIPIQQVDDDFMQWFATTE